ncbi:MAG: hypothetical protein V4510_04390 [bacterium]
MGRRIGVLAVRAGGRAVGAAGKGRVSIASINALCGRDGATTAASGLASLDNDPVVPHVTVQVKHS